MARPVALYLVMLDFPWIAVIGLLVVGRFLFPTESKPHEGSTVPVPNSLFTNVSWPRVVQGLGHAAIAAEMTE